MTAIRQPAQSLEILVAPRDSGGVLITVKGDLDAFSVDYVDAQIGDVFNQSAPTAVDLDLAGVEFIDAAAVVRLRRLHDIAAGAGCILSIRAATQFTWWLVSSTGLASIFPIPEKYRWAAEPGS